MTHGGLLSTLLDEAMAHACINAIGHAITAELTVRFLQPVETGTRIKIVGKVEEIRSRIVAASGAIFDDQERKIASATAKFLLAPGAERGT